MTDKTRALVLNNPSNPTGMLYGREELKEIAKVVRLGVINGRRFKDYTVALPDPGEYYDEIEEIFNSESTEGKTPFDVIDETLYGKEKFQTVKEKIEWVCQNFDKTQTKL